MNVLKEERVNTGDDAKGALVLAPRENFCLAGEGDGVVATTMDVGEEFVGDVFHACFPYVPGDTVT